MILKMLSRLIIMTVVLHTCLSEQEMWRLDGPCTEGKNQTLMHRQYDTFLNHHLHKDAPTDPHKLNDKLEKWQKFINKIQTWDRPIQTFFRFEEAERVKAVCSSAGKKYQGNLCISKEPFTVFTVKINKKKQVKKVKVQQQYVILGCEKILNKCLPIHFEKNRNNDKPDNNNPDCSEAMTNSSFIPFEELFHV